MNSTAIQFHFQTDIPNIRFVQGANVSHAFPCHIHHSFSLGIIQQGQRIIHVDGKTHIVSANECFIINPHQPHSCSAIGNEGHGYGIVSIPSALLQSIFREVKSQNEIPHFPNVKVTDISIVNGFTAWMGKQLRNESPSESELTNILRELVPRYADTEAPLQSKPIKCSKIMLACEYIEANLNRPVRLDELANLTRISPFYLNRIFREEIGIPPYTYLLQTRIKKSLEVLLQTDSIIEATYSLGFSDQSHFSRFFKKNIGLTPKQYLALHKSSIH